MLMTNKLSLLNHSCFMIYYWVQASSSIKFIKYLDDNNKIFAGDVRSDQKIFLQNPEPYLPSRKPNIKGRNPPKKISKYK